MRFLVRRTSNYDQALPCEEAEPLSYTRVQRWAVPDPARAPTSVHDGWYAIGTNHRVENGQICRDLPAEGWAVEIGSLEELLAFQQRHGPVILQDSDSPDLPLLEIYDE